MDGICFSPASGGRLGRLIVILVCFFGLAACQPRDPLAEAAELLKSGRTGEAVEVLREAVANDPEDPELLIQYGTVLVADNRGSLALWPLRQASRVAEFEGRAKKALLGAYVASSEFEQAIELASELLERDSDPKTIYDVRSMAYYEEELYEESLADIESLLATEPDNVHYLRRKLNNLLMLGRAEESKELLISLRQMVEATPGLPVSAASSLCSSAAMLQGELGDLEGAHASFLGCIEEYPEGGMNLARVVRFYDDQERFAESQELMEKVLEVRPRDVFWVSQLSTRLLDQGDPNAGEAVHLNLVQRLNHPTTWLAYADYLMRAGRAERAAEILDASVGMVELSEFPSRKAIALEDLSPDQLFVYGDIWASVGDEEQVARVLNYVEDAALSSFIQARLLVSQKKYAEALAEYHKGLPLWPSNYGARFLMGYASERVGDFDAAVAHYRESVRKAPEARHAGIELIELLLAQNQFEAAKGVLTVYLDERPYDVTALRHYIAMALQMGQIESMDKARETLVSLRDGHDIGTADYVKDLFEHFGLEQALGHLEGSSYRERIQEYPLTLAAWCEVLVQGGRPEEALSLASSVVDKWPQLGEAQAVKAAVLASLNRKEEANQAYRSALVQLPDHYISLVALAELEREAGNAEAAIALYERASSRQEDEGRAAYEAAVLIGTRSNPSIGGARVMEARLRDVLDEHPRFAPAAVDLARAALERGDSSDTVLDYASRGLRFGPGVETAELVAVVRLARGEYKEAANLMYWAIEQGAGRGESYFHLGRALASMGDLEAARGALARALELGPFENIDAARTELQRLGETRAEEG